MLHTQTMAGWLLISLVGLASSMFYHDKELERVNAGVIFNPELRSMTPVAGYRPIVIPLEIPQRLKGLKKAVIPKDLCQLKKSAFTIQQHIQKTPQNMLMQLCEHAHKSIAISNNLLDKINGKHQTLQELLQAFQLRNTDTVKRAIIDISTAAGWLFGLASESQVKKLATKINKIDPTDVDILCLHRSVCVCNE